MKREILFLVATAVVARVALFARFVPRRIGKSRSEPVDDALVRRGDGAERTTPLD